MSNEEWIEWNGGECPVSNTTKVEVKFRDFLGTNDAHNAGDWRWDHAIPGDKVLVPEFDIVAYRVISHE